MRALDLFSGTGSFKKFCQTQDWECTSLDIDGRSDITADILEWDYTQFERDEFNIIGAFPPCNDFSCMNYCRPEKIINLTHSNAIVKRTLEIINYFNPQIWLIENPQTGMLKKQDYMQGLPFIDVDYCQFGFPIRKRTRFWTNLKRENKLCKKNCDGISNGKHLSFKYMNPPPEFIGNRLDFRHMIPKSVFEYLFSKN